MRRIVITILALLVIAAVVYAVRSGSLPVGDGGGGSEGSATSTWTPWQGVLEYQGTNLQVGLTFRYPPEFQRFNTASSTGNIIGKPIIQVKSPDSASMMESATLAAALSGPEVEACYVDPNNPNAELARTVIINDKTFRVGSFEEIIGGVVQEVRIYRTKHKGACYEMALRVQKIPGDEENLKKAWERLEMLMGTFAFVEASLPPALEQGTPL